MAAIIWMGTVKRVKDKRHMCGLLGPGDYNAQSLIEKQFFNADLKFKQ